MNGQGCCTGQHLKKASSNFAPEPAIEDGHQPMRFSHEDVDDGAGLHRGHDSPQRSCVCLADAELGDDIPNQMIEAKFC
jgi:hypothetical protein